MKKIGVVKVVVAAAVGVLLFISCSDGGGGDSNSLTSPSTGGAGAGGLLGASAIDIPATEVGKRAYMATYNLKHGYTIYGDDVGGAILMDSDGNTKPTWALDFRQKTAGGMVQYAACGGYSPTGGGARRMCSMSPAFDRCREEAYRLANRGRGSINRSALAKTNNNGPLDNNHSQEDTLTIKVDTAAAYEYEDKEFTLAAIGTHCDVWAAKDKDTGALPTGYKTSDTPSETISFSDIAAALDKAYEAETNLFGTREFNANALG